MTTWEKYYSTLRHLPDWLEKPAPFIVEASALFRKRGFRVFLDLGCGMGRNTLYLAKEGFDVVGVDISRSGLRKTKSRSNTEETSNLEVLLASMTHLPFIDEAFHVVISLSVIHHATKENIEKAIGEVYKILKEDGMLLANLLSREDYRYGSGLKIEEGTFRILEDFGGFEELHHFFSHEEVFDLLAEFKETVVEQIQRGWVERQIKYWKIIATK